jgi:D-alanyl-D-alanine carboxypeptidase/D-alanyl-D-alanine-endopeptidase (penicillin-binding protein 4)
MLDEKEREPLMPRPSIRWMKYSVVAVALLYSIESMAQSNEPLAARIDKIISRPEFAHANFGIEFYAMDTGRIIYKLNADKLFVPASTTKLLTEGTVLARLGADFRFHTRIYRTGPIDVSGRLKGDLVLVASGDPNLSNRLQPNGTLAFMDDDHVEGGPALPGDPLSVIRKLAQAVYAKGVRQIDGHVLIDASLFPDGPREGGSNVVLSSIVINDNVIDITATPGSNAGDPVALHISPQTSYAHFVNHLTTAAAGGQASLDTDNVSNPDGTATLTLSGSIPVGSAPQNWVAPVPSPTRFATLVLEDSLRATGIKVPSRHASAQGSAGALAHFYTDENLVAEHVSAPLSEDVKVTLKVSQNLHAGIGQYLLGAYVAHDKTDPFKAGFKIEHAFLEEAHLDLNGASQGDGAGGDWADLFSPDFMCSYLIHWSKRPEFDVFFKALPILGKDGTLAKVQTESPAAGHVFAKTGTFLSEDLLSGKNMLNSKGLAGYVFTQSGRKLAFAAYINHFRLPFDNNAAPQDVAGQALGAIAAAAYDAVLPQGP